MCGMGFGGVTVRRGRKKYHYTVDDLIELSGLTENQVRHRMRKGEFDLRSFRSVYSWLNDGYRGRLLERFEGVLGERDGTD